MYFLSFTTDFSNDSIVITYQTKGIDTGRIQSTFYITFPTSNNDFTSQVMNGIIADLKNYQIEVTADQFIIVN